MKISDAPEKIILSADKETGEFHDEWVIRDLTDNIKIEYTRTDALIEKVVTWFDNNFIAHDEYGVISISFDTKEEMFKDFKNYINGPRKC